MATDDTNHQPEDSDHTASESDQPATFRISRSFSFGSRPPPEAGVTIVPGRERRFEWTWRPPGAGEPVPPGGGERDALDEEPATYYEAFTGRRDPQRDTLIKARRILNGVVWAVTLGLPALVVAIAIATGQTLETIVVFGVGALIVGMMFRHSFPRTPFD